MKKNNKTGYYITAVIALATLLVAAFFLNLLPWTSGAPDGVQAGGNLPQEEPPPSEPPPAEPEPEPEPDPSPWAEFPPGADINRLPFEMVVELLQFLQSPIEGAVIGMTDGQLPGAPRTYRNGYHQGIDYYNSFVGVPIKKGTPVLAAADGVVVRIDHDFVEMTSEERAEYHRISAESPTTPEEILDKYRGRQVWLEHEGGVITRYAHLGTVAEDLSVGDIVTAGQQIGTVGNSGTGPGVRGSQTEEMHLHFEIWVNDHFLGEGLAAKDTRSILKAILED